MINIFGDMYYIDFSKIEELIHISTTPSEDEEGKEDMTINIVTFDIVKMMLEVILTERDEVDENLGIISADKLSLPFKFAFNTLIRYNIIKSL